MLDRPKMASRERFGVRNSVRRRSSFAEEVRNGLTSPRKSIPPRYFYDALGSALFAAICELPEYTLTRSEAAILQASSEVMARHFGSPERIVELGSGDCHKSRILLEAILDRQPALTFIPIDVDSGVLESSARELLASLPGLTIDAVCGDFRDVAEIVPPIPGRTVVLFLGSTIGNLDPASASALL